MITRNLVRRLERLEAYLAPPSDEPALIIHLTCVGQDDRIIEVYGDNTAVRRSQPWSPRRTFADWK
jgi:hypothetical protein